MDYKLQKIRRYFDIIKGCRWKNSVKAENILVCPCDYKTGNTPPALSEFVPFENGGEWGTGNDSHAWFRLEAHSDEENRYIFVETNKSGWDASNPQFIVYVDGKITQGLDTNHMIVRLSGKKSYKLHIYATV